MLLCPLEVLESGLRNFSYQRNLQRIIGWKLGCLMDYRLSGLSFYSFMDLEGIMKQLVHLD